VASVGIVGASGYTGVELLRLVAGHPELELAVATAGTQAGSLAREAYPSLAAALPNLAFATYDPAALAGLDLILCALPHGESSQVVPELLGKVGHVVDLGADFRLRDPDLYALWYGGPHVAPALLNEAAFGIPELFRGEIKGARLVAVAGCYVTAAALALAPIARGGWLEDHTPVIVNAVSGISGAGHRLQPSTQFGTVNEDFTAYGLLSHRHTPEIEQALGHPVVFTPHLAPMTRGILATCYVRGRGPSTTEEALAILRNAYAAEPFIVVTEDPPSTKSTHGSNVAHLTARVDPRTGWLIVLCALDNLVKGASGQAIQCANLALGLPETAGLPITGVYP